MNKNGEKSYLPGSKHEWGLELPDGYSNSLVTKDGKNWDNGYNYDDKDDDSEQSSFDTILNEVPFDPSTAQKAIEERRKELQEDGLSESNLEATRNHERQLGIEVSNLTPDDNFEQVAEALYLVDQYIFPDLFQNEENAKQFTKALFSDDPNALFSYSKTLVARDEENNIVGIIVYRDTNCTPWDTESVRKRFEATGLPLPDQFNRANEGYMKKITDAELPKGAAEIEFVGVREDYRANGIGGRLMDAVMNKPEYTEAHLDVLDSHPGARRLYDKLGFEPSGDKFGNYPDGSEGVQHMICKKENLE